jgi:hypothetical protein
LGKISWTLLDNKLAAAQGPPYNALTAQGWKKPKEDK